MAVDGRGDGVAPPSEVVEREREPHAPLVGGALAAAQPRPASSVEPVVDPRRLDRGERVVQLARRVTSRSVTPSRVELGGPASTSR